MSNQILLDLIDLLKAEKELTHLIETLTFSEKDVRALCESISDWQGKSATELQIQLETFSKGMTQHRNKLEMAKVDLMQYVTRMKQADGQ